MLQISGCWSSSSWERGLGKRRRRKEKRGTRRKIYIQNPYMQQHCRFNTCSSYNICIMLLLLLCKSLGNRFSSTGVRQFAVPSTNCSTRQQTRVLKKSMGLKLTFWFLLLFLLWSLRLWGRLNRLRRWLGLAIILIYGKYNYDQY